MNHSLAWTRDFENVLFRLDYLAIQVVIQKPYSVNLNILKTMHHCHFPYYKYRKQNIFIMIIK